jgi:hypothetical protein
MLSSLAGLSKFNSVWNENYGGIGGCKEKKGLGGWFGIGLPAETIPT